MHAERRVSFETYYKRNVNFAAKKLYPEAGKALKLAFRATHCADLYGGELHAYLNVIAQQLEAKNEREKKFKNLLSEIKKKIDDWNI